MAAKPALSRSAEERLAHQRIEQRYSTIRVALRCLVALGCVYFLSQAIGAFAGRTTAVAVNMVLSLLADMRFVISVTLTGAAAAWAIVERSLRYRKVEKMHARILELETMIDARRTSSGLTRRGKTNPDDNGR